MKANQVMTVGLWMVEHSVARECGNDEIRNWNIYILAVCVSFASVLALS